MTQQDESSSESEPQKDFSTDTVSKRSRFRGIPGKSQIFAAQKAPSRTQDGAYHNSTGSFVRWCFFFQAPYFLNGKA